MSAAGLSCLPASLSFFMIWYQQSPPVLLLDVEFRTRMIKGDIPTLYLKAECDQSFSFDSSIIVVVSNQKC